MTAAKRPVAFGAQHEGHAHPIRLFTQIAVFFSFALWHGLSPFSGSSCMMDEALNSPGHARQGHPLLAPPLGQQSRCGGPKKDLNTKKGVEVREGVRPARGAGRTHMSHREGRLHYEDCMEQSGWVVRKDVGGAASGNSVKGFLRKHVIFLLWFSYRGWCLENFAAWGKIFLKLLVRCRIFDCQVSPVLGISMGELFSRFAPGSH